MIALEREVLARKRITDQPVQHSTRVGPAINVIAECDRQRFFNGILVQITRNRLNESIKQIGAAVNVSDCINPIRKRLPIFRIHCLLRFVLEML
jgi:hypothetical protein